MKHKIFIKIAAVAAAVLTIFCGCQKGTNAVIYSVLGTGMTESNTVIDSLTPENLLAELKKKDVIPETVIAAGFSTETPGDYLHLTLDLSADFGEYLAPQDIPMQDMLIRCVANTFIKSYGAENVIITCSGKAISNKKYTYDKPLRFKTVSIELPTPAESTPSPDVTPTPSDTPGTPGSNTASTVTHGPIPTPNRADGKKYIAITFDDGPSAQYTTKIVDKLKEHNASATFFIVGNRVDAKTGAAIKYATENGSEIAVHGYTHTVSYSKCSEEVYKEELSKTAEVIEKYTGKKPTMMRPIGGAITKERTASCPYSVILWNIDSEDWKNKKDGQVNNIVNNVMPHVADGKIILMHEIYKNSYEAFCIIIDKLYEQGYEVVSVSELIGRDNIKPGTKYYGAN